MSTMTHYNTFTRSSQVRLLDAINSANPGLGLTTDDVVFSPPQWNSNQNGYNTVVRIISSGHGDVLGNKDFFYNRQDLQSVFGLEIPVLLKEPTHEKLSDLLPQLLQKHRVWLDASDIIDVDVTSVVANGETSIILKVSGDSLGWYGQLRLKVRPVTTVLDTRIQNTVGDIGYLNDAQSKSQAELWYGVRRHTNQGDVNRWLDAAPMANDPLTAEMVSMLSSVFGAEWHNTPGVSEDHNLDGASVAYFGPVLVEHGIQSPQGSYLSIIRLGENCRNFEGFLMVVLPGPLVEAHNNTP